LRGAGEEEGWKKGREIEFVKWLDPKRVRGDEHAELCPAAGAKDEE